MGEKPNEADEGERRTAVVDASPPSATGPIRLDPTPARSGTDVSGPAPAVESTTVKGSKSNTSE